MKKATVGVATSLNRRLSMAVVGVTSGVVLIAAFTVWLATRSVLLEGVDRELIVRAERLRHFDPMANADFWRNAFMSPEIRRRIERSGPNDQRHMVMVVVSAIDGTELHRSSSLPLDADLSIKITASEKPTPSTKVIGSSGAIRVIALKMEPDSRSHGHSDSTFFSFNSVIVTTSDDSRFVTNPFEHKPGTNNDTTFSPADKTTAADEMTGEKATAEKITTADTTDEKTSIEKPTEPKKREGVIAYLGLDLTQVDNELSRMAWMLAGLWFGATLLAFATIRFLHRSVLRPARELATAISAMGPDDLTRRLPPHAGPVELSGVVHRLNGLFDSLEQAFKREQATIANIAHELRTPVASLRTALEFRHMETATEEERTAIRGYLDTVERMQTQVTNLLLLARLEAGKETLECCDVHIGDLIDEAADRWQPRALERQQSIHIEKTEDDMCSMSPDHFCLVLDNLISNAVSHGNTNDTIAITVTQDPNGCCLSVSNNFSGELDNTQLGQAYYRGDQARSRDDHCGLGLALCQRLCRLLGATLTLTNADGRFTAEVRLPK